LFLAKDEQLERFVSGTGDLVAGTLVLKPSELGVAKEYEEDFKKITNPRVVVTYLGDVAGPVPLEASWKDGTLTITGTAAKVAFIVDTWTNNGE
jgi:hypothetical protein